MTWHISLLVIIALSPHPVLICLIFGVITSYEICKVNYICFFFKYNFIVNKIEIYIYIYIVFIYCTKDHVDVANKPLLLLLLLLLLLFIINSNAKYLTKDLRSDDNDNNFSLLDVYLDKKGPFAKIKSLDVFKVHHLVATVAVVSYNEWALSWPFG